MITTQRITHHLTSSLPNNLRDNSDIDLASSSYVWFVELLFWHATITTPLGHPRMNLHIVEHPPWLAIMTFPPWPRDPSNP